MPISIDQWRVAVGLFWSLQICCYHQKKKKMIWKYSNLEASTVLLFFYSTVFFLLLVQYGDIEINPGLPKKQQKYFPCCHWNVSSLLAHIKISLLTAYNTINQYDVICISETFLDSSVLLDDHNLSIQGYSLIWAGLPDNVKRCGVWCLPIF